MRPSATAWRTWRWPTAIAAASLLGLVAALVGGEGWAAASWIGLAWPVVVCVRCGFGRRHVEETSKRALRSTGRR